MSLFVFIGIFLYHRFTIQKSIRKEQVKPYEPPFTKNGRLVFLKKDVTDTLKVIDIEIADDDIKRTQGLMWRHSMAERNGMVFIFDEENPLNFWIEKYFYSS